MTEARLGQATTVRRRLTRPRLAALAVVAALAAGATAWAALGGSEDDRLDGRAMWSTHRLYRVTVAPAPASAPVNRMHAWQLELRDADDDPVTGASISVVGDMPAHGHGLPTAPRTRELGDGRYEVQGMKFQMGGAWYVAFTIAADAGRDVVRVDFVLPGG